MTTFRYTRSGYEAYFLVEGRPVTTASDFRELCREVYSRACPVTVGTVFSVGLAPALVGEAAETLAERVWPDDEDAQKDFMDLYPARVAEAVAQEGVRVTCLGWMGPVGPFEEDLPFLDRMPPEPTVTTVEDFELTDLAPCGFCHCDARVEETYDPDLERTRIDVACANDECGAQVTVTTPQDCPYDVEMSAREQAVDAWNQWQGRG